MAHRRALRRWSNAADAADHMDLDELRSLRVRGRDLRREIDRVLRRADGRLILPRIGADAIRAPAGADWTWRPDLWRGTVRPRGAASVATGTALGGGVKVFHDCPHREIALRQVRNTRPTDLAPFGLTVEVFHFGGGFLSVALDLPEPAIEGLRRRFIVRIDALIEAEKPLTCFARLNLRHGPNVERLVRELALDAPTQAVEFDLIEANINESRISAAWVELIFEDPAQNRITLRDLTMSRRPRAEL